MDHYLTSLTTSVITAFAFLSLQTRTLRLREGKQLAQGHAARAQTQTWTVWLQDLFLLCAQDPGAQRSLGSRASPFTRVSPPSERPLRSPPRHRDPWLAPVLRPGLHKGRCLSMDYPPALIDDLLAASLICLMYVNFPHLAPFWAPYFTLSPLQEAVHMAF